MQLVEHCTFNYHKLRVSIISGHHQVDFTVTSVFFSMHIIVKFFGKENYL